MRYLDTGGRDPEHSLYRWLENNLPGAASFACQSGYFSGDGIFPLEAHFKDLLDRGGDFHLVVGGNEGGVRSDDLAYVLDLFDGTAGTGDHSLTLVAADDVLMHPKTFLIGYPDGSFAALVGSVNLTGPGSASNIEAAISMATSDDAAAPFAEIGDAIAAWRDGSRPNAIPIDRPEIARLISEGILDGPRRVAPPGTGASRTARKARFPRLGPLLRLPRRSRGVVSKVPPTKVSPTTAVPTGTLGTLPKGAVGVIKRLSNLDTKTFRGEQGTAYIALPRDVAAFLPMKPAGANGEPRVDISIEARLDSAPDQIVTSGVAPTNITHVGMGVRASSHSDLRLNYLQVVATGIRHVVAFGGCSGASGGGLGGD